MREIVTFLTTVDEICSSKLKIHVYSVYHLKLLNKVYRVIEKVRSTGEEVVHGDI